MDHELLEAARIGNLERVKELIKAGADVNARDEYERAPLYLASKSINLELVKELLAAGADVNALDKIVDTKLGNNSFENLYK